MRGCGGLEISEVVAGAGDAITSGFMDCLVEGNDFKPGEFEFLAAEEVGCRLFAHGTDKALRGRHVALGEAIAAPGGERGRFEVEPRAFEQRTRRGGVERESQRVRHDAGERADAQADRGDAHGALIDQLLANELDHVLNDGYLVHVAGAHERGGWRGVYTKGREKCKDGNWNSLRWGRRRVIVRRNLTARRRERALR